MESKRITKIQIVYFGIIMLFIACQNPTPTSTSSYSKSILAAREEKVFQFNSPETSPVLQLNEFKGLKFYPVNSEYRIVGEITKLKGNREVLLQTTANKKKRYFEFAEVTFQINGTNQTVIAFQENNSSKELFIPFQDKTNYSETYKGGRYLNAQLIENNQVLLDFNLAYHPYCLYNPEYVCPLPPEENRLNISVKAGEKL